MTIEVMPKTRVRLKETLQGQALLDLIDQYGTPSLAAHSLGIEAYHIRQWIYRGRISRHGVIEIEQASGKTKSQLRPDLKPEDWICKPSGPAAKVPAVARTPDAKLLVKLAEQHGGVKELCALAYCTTGDYRTWKSRGKIPAIKLPTFLALQK